MLPSARSAQQASTGGNQRPRASAGICRYIRVQADPFALDGTKHAVLYQDANWSFYGRWQYGFIVFPLLLLGLIGSISTGVPAHVALVLAIFTPVIVACEWRMRKMGLVISDDGIELVRPLNRTRIAWSEIEGFKLRMSTGLVDYGTRRVAVKRRRHHVPHQALPVPTVLINTQEHRPRWLFPPQGLKWSGGKITDVMGFLNEQLAEHQPTAPQNVASA
jgi:hypothetical protein